MKRRTNLFYNEGIDSKFLTFSNYTECLTGTLLSTNTKLFPSKFICLNIPNLNKVNFINDLVAYYENKLATLRDYVIRTDGKTLENIKPLSYLLRFLSNKGITNIAYVGDITEQDYNGTFADSICVINTGKMYTGLINLDTITAGEDNTFVDGETGLYGWYVNNTYQGPANYSSVSPIFDEQNKYLLTDNNFITISETPVNSVEFNVIIPMFSMVNSDSSILNTEEQTMLETVEGGTETIIGSNYINVPMGIWFADKQIILSGDETYNESWSLVIGSQFKPFPNSNKITSDITNESNSIAFGTFAQILSRQNDLFTYFTNEIAKLQTEIKKLKNTQNN